MATSSGAVRPAHEVDNDRGLKRAIGPGLLLLFIIGDVLGTGVYALTGKVAADVGGMVWLPFMIAFAVAFLTAFSYLELVTKYPRAGGAAVFAHKAFNLHFLTFVVAFLVMSSGLTSSASGAKAFASNLAHVAGWELADDSWGLLALAAGFLILLAIINARGVSESLWTNVVLTCVELSGLLIVIVIGLWAIGGGNGDTSRLTEFSVPEGMSSFTAVTAATGLAFFAMVGFEDSVNMAEETKNPVRTFPKIMLGGLLLTGLVYLLVSISAVALVEPTKLSEGNTPLLQVIQAGAPDFPVSVFAVITMFAVANTALLNMLMASRLLYGMAREGVLPRGLGAILPTRRTPYAAIIVTTVLALGLIWLADLKALGSTTALLLLIVFAVVNIAVLVLKRNTVDHAHFRAPVVISGIAAIACTFLALPFSGRPPKDYQVAGVLLAIGIVLWAVYFLIRRSQGKPMSDLAHLEEYADELD